MQALVIVLAMAFAQLQIANNGLCNPDLECAPKEDVSIVCDIDLHEKQVAKQAERLDMKVGDEAHVCTGETDH